MSIESNFFPPGIFGNLDIFILLYSMSVNLDELLQKKW